MNKQYRLKNVTIDKCLSHLDMLNANAKTKQIVYMYMAELYQKAFDEGVKYSQRLSGMGASKNR